MGFENSTSVEIKNRISLAWKKFWALKKIFKGPYSNKIKSAVFNSCIIPVVTYGAQTWEMTKQDENGIRVTQDAMERSMMNLKLRDKFKIAKIKSFRKKFEYAENSGKEVEMGRVLGKNRQ